mmetsp:Transcript_25184/g.63935  ORF Transcript_25184/g.63935 Transcript_25184/m.63935 type:complete len:310 (+) Transcript_25184:1563-2492(+)
MRDGLALMRTSTTFAPSRTSAKCADQMRVSTNSQRASNEQAGSKHCSAADKADICASNEFCAAFSLSLVFVCSAISESVRPPIECVLDVDTSRRALPLLMLPSDAYAAAAEPALALSTVSLATCNLAPHAAQRSRRTAVARFSSCASANRCAEKTHAASATAERTSAARVASALGGKGAAQSDATSATIASCSTSGKRLSSRGRSARSRSNMCKAAYATGTSLSILGAFGGRGTPTLASRCQNRPAVSVARGWLCAANVMRAVTRGCRSAVSLPPPASQPAGCCLPPADACRPSIAGCDDEGSDGIVTA